MTWPVAKQQSIDGCLVVGQQARVEDTLLDEIRGRFPLWGLGEAHPVGLLAS